MEELLSLYSSPNIVRKIRPRTVRRAAMPEGDDDVYMLFAKPERRSILKNYLNV
jgi:hypothetical protein